MIGLDQRCDWLSCGVVDLLVYEAKEGCCGMRGSKGNGNESKEYHKPAAVRRTTLLTKLHGSEVKVS